jgi:MFS family permease
LSTSSVFAPLKNRNFSLYFAGQGISLMGTFMQQVAQQWLVWDLSHDTRMIGMAGALAFLPMLALGPFSSSLADRVNRRRLLVITQIADMLLAFALAALVVMGNRSVLPVLALSAVLGISAAFTIPAQSAFIGDLSGMAHIRSAYTIYGMVIETARLIGPAVAGQVVAWFGTATAFALNGLSFIAVIISLLIVRAQQAQNKAPANALKDFAESVRFMRGQPRIVDLVACRVMVMLFIFSSLQLAAPIADQVLHAGPEMVGNMLAASGAGALLGALLVGPQLQRIPRAGVALCLSLAWSGMWLAIMSFFSTPITILLGIFLYSVNIPVVLTNVSSLAQLLSPPNMRARLGGAMQMISSAAQPLGALLVGWMGNALGPLMAIRFNGALMALFALGLLVFSADFRAWEPERA